MQLQMTNIIIFIITCLVVYNYFKSKSNFFNQDPTKLRVKRQHLWMVLTDFNIGVNRKQEFLTAYDYFTIFPKEYDGATIVQDLDIINGLDACAMLHDYWYLHNNVWSIKGLKNKLFYDWEYGKNMEKLGVSPLTAYTRSILLIIATPLYYLIKLNKLWQSK